MLRLIDWQCPAIGDPIVDIMMFLSPGMHEIYGSGKLSHQRSSNFFNEPYTSNCEVGTIYLARFITGDWLPIVFGKLSKVS